MASKMDTKLDYLTTTKSLIKQAIINKGVSVTEDSSFREYANMINNLEIASDQSDATATASDILQGKVAYNDNNKIIGTLPQYNSIQAELNSLTLNDTNKQATGSYVLDFKLVLNNNSNINFKMSYSDLAACIGLTPDKIVEGETILGINGTAKSITDEDYDAIRTLIDNILD